MNQYPSATRPDCSRDSIDICEHVDSKWKSISGYVCKLCFHDSLEASVLSVPTVCIVFDKECYTEQALNKVT